MLRILIDYDYPGNVRELRNAIERAVIMAEGTPIGLQHLPERLLASRPAGVARDGQAPGIPVEFIAGIDTLETIEKKMIIQALKKTGGMKAEAAELLGISRHQLLRRIRKYQVNV